ncbi:hypothetical protein KEM56_004799 [Ascosphaera pollenicola]|nr:hypothetical protein KEM56_004799 [Ascosphaera pollenicola]
MSDTSAALSAAQNDDSTHSQPSPHRIAAIDALLVRYLDLLNQYQKEQADVNRYLSSGFFSLARANLHTTSGHRYGQNYYDQRMKATKKLSIDVEQKDQPPEGYSVHMIPIHVKTSAASPDASTVQPSPDREKSNHTNTTKIDHSKHTAMHTSNLSSTQTQGDGDNMPEGQQISPLALDPINWFGILVPQSLREAQRSFANVVDGPICHVASLLADMVRLENEIWILRNTPEESYLES